MIKGKAVDFCCSWSSYSPFRKLDQSFLCHSLSDPSRSTLPRMQIAALTVKKTTSCSSTRYTRDHISLAFGDAYGNQVYAPRIDNP
ncbi:embryo-specific protein ATS3A-like [Hevea brasiliensis]|uniref:embryo-specific protein ATS3A-like n=1 Tax=Hevea brasiliensis TaxID=3981 RepID=UPI0025E665A3|nr:embryo-specific protein ATS3A-like [Hevea brasiliensis]